MLSHPTRVRGLKSASIKSASDFATVAPYTGAWIEIDNADGTGLTLSRTLHGCVD